MHVNALLNPVYTENAPWHGAGAGVGVGGGAQPRPCLSTNSQRPVITPKMIVDEAAAAMAMAALAVPPPRKARTTDPKMSVAAVVIQAQTTTHTAHTARSLRTARTAHTFPQAATKPKTRTRPDIPKTDRELMPPPPPRPPKPQQQQHPRKKKKPSLRQALRSLTHDPNLAKAALRRQRGRARHAQQQQQQRLQQHIDPELFRGVFGTRLEEEVPDEESSSDKDGLCELFAQLARKKKKSKAPPVTPAAAAASLPSPDMERAAAEWNANIRDKARREGRGGA